MNLARPSAVSIFSGVGGLDLGFHKAGFDIIFSTDIWPIACDSLRKNKLSGYVECRDIREINFRKELKSLGINEIDCLIGGPPCPPYSKSRFYLKEKKRALADENSYTLKEYFRAVSEIQPKVFLFENVHGFIYRPHLEALNFVKKQCDSLGYNIAYKVVNAANFGVPQIRERFICIGVKRGLPKFIFPKSTHYNLDKNHSEKGQKPWVTCGDVLTDLDYSLPEDKKMEAGSKHKDLLKLVPPGENYLFFTKEKEYPRPVFKWRSRYWSFLLKLSPNKPSWTIQASHSNNMGPFHWKNRFLRISEIKRIQSFDDNYVIIGDFRDQWRQVGNAVPPLLAKVFAEAIKKQILEVKGLLKQELCLAI